ncbi:MAG: V4R domain-containing protein [Nitrososphaerota archaeon]|nr:hypothetical protein [Aigarchaeota archaeon]MDW8076774.1 V4R domain-containing protein [Nitrososphaerota archaeon]
MNGFNIGRFLFLPGRKVFGILVVAELDPMVLKEISDLGLKHKVLVPTIQYNLVEGGKIIGLGFVDLTDANISIDEFAEKIRSIKGVKSVRIIHPTTEGFVADDLSVRLLLAGERAIILRRPGYEGFIVGIRERFGTAGEAFLYHTGYQAGIRYGRVHQDLASRLGIKDPIQIIHKLGVPTYASIGLGKLEIVEASPAFCRLIIRAYENFECELGIGSKKPYSNFVRGVFAGFIAQLFGKQMKAEELKCIAKGDPYCEFEITPE